jgi:hypothetical protein
MNANAYKHVDYENFCVFELQKNKAKQTQFQVPAHIPKKLEDKNRLRRLLINRIKALYKPVYDRYYSRHIRRCSSMVEHSFRKAGVEGPTPSIGFIYTIVQYLLKKFQSDV